MDGTSLFQNRFDAGERLSRQLQSYRNDPNTIILALPRGGVPVGYAIAKALQLPLDILIVRKLGVPFQEELAMGAIASGDVIFFNDDVIADLGISEAQINRVIEAQKAELSRREKKYRQDRPFPAIEQKNIILVDDGIATGATMHAAIIALRKLSVKKIIMAVSVAPRETLAKFSKLVDEVACLHSADVFYGVGAFYEDFSQTTDEEVIALLTELSH
jgi:putative phosphoribosyl transferase